MLQGPDAWDCDSDGHDWQKVGTAPDGTTFIRCKKCGEEDER